MSEPIRVLIADDMSKKAVEILSGCGIHGRRQDGDEAGGAGGGDRPVPRRRRSLGQQDQGGHAGQPGQSEDHRPRRRRRRQHRRQGGDREGHPRHQHAAGQRGGGGGAGHRSDVRARAQDPPGGGYACATAIWEKKKFMGVEIAGKTLGVVGLGNIGRQAAERGVGLKMNVIGFDPYPPKQLPAGVKVVTFDELVAKSDFITLHIPLVPETKNLFGAATFAKMKKGSYLINCARGGVVDEDAVLEALTSGQLAGAALDVFGKEPPDPAPAVQAREPDREPAPGRVDARGAGEGGDRAGGGVRRLPQGRHRPQRGGQAAVERIAREGLLGHGRDSDIETADGHARSRAGGGVCAAADRRRAAGDVRAARVRARHHARVRVRGGARARARRRRARGDVPLRRAELGRGGRAAPRHHAADRAADRHPLPRSAGAGAAVLRGDGRSPRARARAGSGS